MKVTWVLVALLSMAASPAVGLQTGTPESALEELATADKPELIERHLPEPVRKQIDDLPKPVKQRVMDSLLQIKSDQFNGCAVRRADDSDAWLVVGKDGKTKGKITLGGAFIFGIKAILPLRYLGPDGAQTYFVTMHLDGDEWRFDGFGPWEKQDTGLNALLHQPTDLEQKNTAAEQTLQRLRGALFAYANSFREQGFPHSLLALTTPPRNLPEPMARLVRPYLEPAFANDPAVVDGFEFRYLLTMPGNGENSRGEFQMTASPVEFGKTGSHHYLMSTSGAIFCTSEDRPATQEDSCDQDSPVGEDDE